MSTWLLLAIGVLVTLVVSIGVGLPIYGAILDGRYPAEREGAEVRKLSDKSVDRRSAA